MSFTQNKSKPLQVIRLPHTAVGYHFVIHTDGTIYQTRKLSEEGAHTLGMNKSSIGVCFMGNFDLHYPSKEQLDSWNTLFTKLREEYPNIPTYPHRAYATKSCHGKLLTDDYFSLQHQRLSLIEELKRKIAFLMSVLTSRRQK